MKKIILRLIFGRRPWLTIVRAGVLGAALYLGGTFCFRPTILRGISMEPTYMDGQFGFINRLTYRTRHPRRGDVVVIKALGDSSFYLKRVLAYSGETVEFRNGDLFVEGEQVPEPYITDKGMWSMQPVKVPAGEFFVAGDNRAVDISNHVLGAIPPRYIAGSLIL
jgi:signal peptidase I